MKSLQLRLDQISAQFSRLADGYSEGILVGDVVLQKQNALLTEKKDIEDQLEKRKATEKRTIAAWNNSSNWQKTHRKATKQEFRKKNALWSNLPLRT